MSDPNVSLGFAIQLIVTAFAAGGAWFMLADTRKRQREESEKQEKGLKEAAEKQEKGLKEIGEKHERDLKDVRDRAERDVASAKEYARLEIGTLRTDSTRTMADIRAEAQQGREAIRVEVNAIIAQSTAVRDERLTKLIEDFEKLNESIDAQREENRNWWTALSKEMQDQHWRMKNLEDDAKEAGWKRTTSSSRTPAAERVERPHHPAPHQPTRPGFDPKVPR